MLLDYKRKYWDLLAKIALNSTKQIFDWNDGTTEQNTELNASLPSSCYSGRPPVCKTHFLKHSSNLERSFTIPCLRSASTEYTDFIGGLKPADQPKVVSPAGMGYIRVQNKPVLELKQ